MFIVNDEYRKVKRSSLPLPIRLEVRAEDNSVWFEDTTLKDVSVNGAGFSLTRNVERGRLILVNIPMPGELRRYAFSKADYPVWGIVQRCVELKNLKSEPSFAVGVAFIGAAPPPDYQQRPNRIYEIEAPGSAETEFWRIAEADEPFEDSETVRVKRWRPTRLSIPEELVLEIMDENDHPVWSETTITENISLRGAAVFTQSDAEPGSFVRVTSHRHDLTLLSIIRSRRTGEDGIPRLHLEFIDVQFPLEGIV